MFYMACAADARNASVLLSPPINLASGTLIEFHVDANLLNGRLDVYQTTALGHIGVLLQSVALERNSETVISVCLPHDTYRLMFVEYEMSEAWKVSIESVQQLSSACQYIRPEGIIKVTMPFLVLVRLAGVERCDIFVNKNEN